MTLQPCLTCGEPSEANRCEQHTLTTPCAPKAPPDSRGYDQAWRNLSKRARRLQPFCSDCGAVEDLQADHTPEAWARKAEGKSIRLVDIDIVCGPCNRDRGAARGEGRQHNALPTQRLKAKFPSHNENHSQVTR